MSQESYPRPDFVRDQLHWLSLNGPWDFLFDDDDVGLQREWQRHGLPSSVTVTTGKADKDQTEAESITQKIVGDAGKILKDNVFAKSGQSTVHHKQKITVPFVFQTKASGINEQGAHEFLWYERTIKDLRNSEERSKKYRLLLCFNAVDYEATVWVDGQQVGAHQGGHVPFDVDITDAVGTGKESSRLTLRVRDSTYDLTQPRGKQYWAAKPESIFYTPSSGIWQNVWLESVPPVRIRHSSDGTLLQSDSIQDGKLRCEIGVHGWEHAGGSQVKVEASFAGVPVSTGIGSLSGAHGIIGIQLPLRVGSQQLDSLSSEFQALSKDPVSFSNNVFLWTPAHPHLYDITIHLLSSDSTIIDSVKTYTGMRSLRWSKTSGRFLLNDRPLFQRLCLDQGYWRDTGMTPPSVDALKQDILLAQRMGFNGCRKHQKVEDPAFLYFADKLGYLVWGEMANAYQFSQQYIERFDKEWKAAMMRDRNHPCIVTWTPVNESWAYTDLTGNVEQRQHLREVYRRAKALDETRPVNDNCGWEHVGDDLSTFHDYADGEQLEKTCATLEGCLADKAGRKVFVEELRDKNGKVLDPGAKHREGAPVLCTEMGGVNVKGGEGKDWGYTTASDAEDLLKRVERLVLGAVKGGVICGFVWTQLTDIEQEANGLYDPDRKPKLDADRVRAIMEEGETMYHRLLEGGKH